MSEPSKHDLGESNELPSVTLCVCTRGRAEAFEVCIRSLCEIRDHQRFQFALVVVENDEPDYASDVMETVSPPFPYTVVNVPEAGISNARNAAVSAFLHHGGAWMGFVDDDEIIDPEWLSEMYNAMQFFENSRAFAGPTFEIFPAGVRKYFERSYSRNKFGEATKQCGTGNVLLHRSIFDESGLGLRFDPRKNVSGGEDSALFQEMLDKGVPVIWVPAAICHEKVTEDGAKFWQRAKILIKAANNETCLLIDRYGRFLGLLRTLRRMVAELYRGFGNGVMLILFGAFSKPRRAKYFSKMLRGFLMVYGCLLTIFAGRSTHYSSS